VDVSATLHRVMLETLMSGIIIIIAIAIAVRTVPKQQQ
jgi:hypothetical protein